MYQTTFGNVDNGPEKQWTNSSIQRTLSTIFSPREVSLKEVKTFLQLELHLPTLCNDI